MSMLDRLLRRKSFTPENVPQDTSQPLAYALTLPDEYDYKRAIGVGSTTSIVGVFLNWLIRQYPEAVLEVTKAVDGNVEAVVPHDLTELVERPNDYYDGSVLWAGKIISIILDGNAYWLKVRNQSTRMAELWYIPHFMIEPKGRPGEFLAFYEWRVGGVRYEVPPEDMVHYRFGVDPENPRKGRAPLKEQMRELYSDEEAARFTAALLHNFGVPGTVVTPGEGAPAMDQPATDAIKAKFDQGFGGSNRGSTIVLSHAAKVEPFTFSPSEMNLRDLRSIPEERVSAATGIPAAVVGLGAGLAQTKVGATMHELRELATENALVPQWKDDAKQLKRALLYEYHGDDPAYGLRFNTSDVRVLQEDRDKLHARTLAAFHGGLISSQAAEAILGYPVNEARDVFYVPISVMVVPADDPMPAPGPKALGMKAAANELAFLRFLERMKGPIEERYAEVLERLFAELGKLAEVAYRNAPKAVAPEDEALARLIMDGMQIAAFVDGNLKPAWQAEYKATADMVIGGYETLLNVEFTIGQRDFVAEQLISEGGRRAGLYDITGNTRSALLRALTEARAEGLGIPATARRIREHVPAGRFVDAGASYRARMIARTETRYATNVSVARAGRTAGFETWRAYDNRTGFNDADCVARDGQEFSEDGMMSELAQEHPNGTLAFAPVPRTSGG